MYPYDRKILSKVQQQNFTLASKYVNYQVERIYDSWENNKMTHWLNDLLNATKRAESPRSFIVWSGLSAVSAIVNNKVYLEKGGLYTLYPNIYVMLVAPSGLRKGYPVSVAKKLVSDIGVTRTISGRSSIQAIVKTLATTTSVPGKGIVIRDSIGYINSGEFSTSLVRDPDSLTILTDLHDGHYNPEWVNTLKGSGKEELKNVCLTLLGAMNPTHFNDVISMKEISGGFIARCFLVFETKRSRKDSLLRAEAGDKVNYPELEKHLFELTKLKGPFVIEEEGIVAYDLWYQAFEPEDMDDKTGTANRIHDQILKVAMLLALCKRSDSLIITETEIRESITLCTQTTASVKRITSGSGIHLDAPKLKLFIDMMLSATAYTMTRSDILHKQYGNLDKYDLDRIVDTLVEAGGLQITGGAGNAVYTLTQRAIEGQGIKRDDDAS